MTDVPKTAQERLIESLETTASLAADVTKLIPEMISPDEPRHRIALFNADGVCINVLVGTLGGLAAFMDSASGFRDLAGTPFSETADAADVPNIADLDLDDEPE